MFKFITNISRQDLRLHSQGWGLDWVSLTLALISNMVLEEVLGYHG